MTLRLPHACVVVCLLLPGAAACTGTAAPAANTTPATQPQDARLLSDAVVVLPVHEVTLETSRGPLPPDSVDSYRATFDTELRRVLQPHVGGAWIWADDLRTMHRRNPLNVPDPTRLATRDMRGSRLAAEQILSADLGTQLRALLAVAGARRYALLPLRLHAGPTSHGGHAGGVTLLVIDTRRSMIVQVRPVALRSTENVGTSGVPLTAVVRRLADIARSELTGPDAR